MKQADHLVVDCLEDVMEISKHPTVTPKHHLRSTAWVMQANWL